MSSQTINLALGAEVSLLETQVRYFFQGDDCPVVASNLVAGSQQVYLRFVSFNKLSNASFIYVLLSHNRTSTLDELAAETGRPELSAMVESQPVTFLVGATPIIIAAGSDTTEPYLYIIDEAQYDALRASVEADNGVNASVNLTDGQDNAHGVSGFDITSDPPGSGDAYGRDEVIEIEVELEAASEDVRGTPQLEVQIGGHMRLFDYVSGSGTDTLVFEYTTVEDDDDTSGISIPSSGGLVFDNGTIVTAHGDAENDFAALPNQAGHQVDGELISLGSLSVDTAGYDVDILALYEIAPGTGDSTTGSELIYSAESATARGSLIDGDDRWSTGDATRISRIRARTERRLVFHDDNFPNPLVLQSYFQDVEPLVVLQSGDWTLTTNVRGSGGFNYMPFYVDEADRANLESLPSAAAGTRILVAFLNPTPLEAEVSASAGTPSASIGVRVVDPIRISMSASAGTPSGTIDARLVFDTGMDASAGTPSASMGFRVVDPQYISVSASAGIPQADVSVRAVDPVDVAFSAGAGTPGGRIRVSYLADPEDVYFVDDANDELVVLRDLYDPDSAEVVGPMPGSMGSVQAMCWHADRLYCIEHTETEQGAYRCNLWRINHSMPSDESGQFGVLGVMPSNCGRPYTMFSHNNYLYVVDANGEDVYQVDEDSPSLSTHVGNLPVQASGQQGVAAAHGSFVMDSEAYVVDRGDREVWHLDLDSLSSGTQREGTLPSEVGSVEGAASYLGDALLINSQRELYRLSDTDDLDEVELLCTLPSGMQPRSLAATVPDAVSGYVGADSSAARQAGAGRIMGTLYEFDALSDFTSIFPDARLGNNGSLRAGRWQWAGQYSRGGGNSTPSGNTGPAQNAPDTNYMYTESSNMAYSASPTPAITSANSDSYTDYTGNSQIELATSAIPDGEDRTLHLRLAIMGAYLGAGEGLFVQTSDDAPDEASPTWTDARQIEGWAYADVNNEGNFSSVDSGAVIPRRRVVDSGFRIDGAGQTVSSTANTVLSVDGTGSAISAGDWVRLTDDLWAELAADVAAGATSMEVLPVDTAFIPIDNYVINTAPAYTTVEDGGWADFEIDIPDSAQRIRLRPVALAAGGGADYQHDLSFRSLQFEYAETAAESPATNEQSWTLGAEQGGSTEARWLAGTIPDEQFADGFKADPTDVRYPVDFRFNAYSGNIVRVTLSIHTSATGDSGNQELSDQFEGNWEVDVAYNDQSWTFTHEDFPEDTSEPYLWQTTDATLHARMSAMIAAVNSVSGVVITWRDGPKQVIETFSISASAGTPSASINVEHRQQFNIAVDASAGTPSANMNVRIVAPVEISVSASAGTPSASIGVRSSVGNAIRISASAGTPSASIGVRYAPDIHVSVDASAGTPSGTIGVDYSAPSDEVGLDTVSAQAGELARLLATAASATQWLDHRGDSSIGTLGAGSDTVIVEDTTPGETAETVPLDIAAVIWNGLNELTLHRDVGASGADTTGYNGWLTRGRLTGSDSVIGPGGTGPTAFQVRDPGNNYSLYLSLAPDHEVEFPLREYLSPTSGATESTMTIRVPFADALTHGFDTISAGSNVGVVLALRSDYTAHDIRIDASAGTPRAGISPAYAGSVLISISARAGTPSASIGIGSGSAPTDLALDIGDGYVVARFDPRSSALELTDYEYSTDDGTTWTSAGVTAPFILILGLKNGVEYDIRVRSVFGTVRSTPSDAVTVTLEGPARSQGDLDAFGPSATLDTAADTGVRGSFVAAAAPIYSDIGNQPSVRDRIVDLDAVFTSLENIFVTKRDERVFNLDVTADLEPLLFRRVSDETAQEIRRRSIDAIRRWEPRVRVVNSLSFVAVNEDEDGYDVDFVFDVHGFDDPQRYEGFLARS